MTGCWRYFVASKEERNSHNLAKEEARLRFACSVAAHELSLQSPAINIPFSRSLPFYFQFQIPVELCVCVGGWGCWGAQSFSQPGRKLLGQNGVPLYALILSALMQAALGRLRGGQPEGARSWRPAADHTLALSNRFFLEEGAEWLLSVCLPEFPSGSAWVRVSVYSQELLLHGSSGPLFLRENLGEGGMEEEVSGMSCSPYHCSWFQGCK